MKPVIEKANTSYPCLWQYRQVGKSEAAMRTAIAACLREKAPEVKTGNDSSGGRYASLEVEPVMACAGERGRLFRLLAGQREMNMVL